MHNSKLISYLKALSAAELHQLHLYIQSPYFFEGRQLGMANRLFDFLQPYHPVFSAEDITIEKVFENCYPDQPFDKRKVESMIYHLFKVVEQFVMHHFSPKGEVNRHLVNIRFLREKGLLHLFDLSVKKLAQVQQKRQQQGSDYYRQQLELAEEVMQKENLRNLRSSDLNLPQLHQHLDSWYLIKKLEYACHLLAQSKHHMPLAVDDSIRLLQELQPALEEGLFNHIPLVKLYYEVFLWLQGDKAASATFVQYLEQNSENIPTDQLKSIHALYRNYCIRRYNEGEEAFLHRLFDIYCLSLEQGLLFNNGGLLQSTMQNMVSIGLKLKQFDWVLQFLETYKEQIVDTANPKEVYGYNLARYYFEQDQFEKALACLADDYEDRYYKLEAKMMEIKIYYELDTDLLDYKMQAFKMYLHRISSASLPEVQREGFKHFIDLLKQICHPSTLKNAERIEKLRQRLASKKVITEREWLRRKLEEQQ